MTDKCACIDISHWQDFPDFKKVKAAGVVACIMKASEGISYVDPNRAKNFEAATKAGIACCTYHWIKPGHNAAEQMKFYLKTINPVVGERVVIDYEENGCTLSDLHEAVKTLLGDKRNLKITIYSGHLLKEQLGEERDQLLDDHTDLWLAQYTSGAPSWPDGTYDKWTLWQYSETGKIDGISGGSVDLNRFDGSNDELIKWISPGGGEIKPVSPEPQPTQLIPVDVNLSEPKGVRLTVMVNHEIVYQTDVD